MDSASTIAPHTPRISTSPVCRRSLHWPNRRLEASGLQTFRFSQSLRFSSRVWQTHRVLIGLFPELDAPGGIQRAGRHLALVMSEYAASHKMEYRFLSLNDSQELHRMQVADREFVFTGAARGKARFAATAMRAARRRPKLVVALHPNLAPIVSAMRVLAPRMKSIICTHGVEVWEPDRKST